MKVKRFFKAVHQAFKAEIQEIRELKITEEDLDQAEKITGLMIATLGAYGVALLPLKPVIKKVLAYGIRDIKDGVKTPNKLILVRIKEELKK